MRRGFKTHAKKLAMEVRDELGLQPLVPLDPMILAEEYGVPVYILSELDSWGCDAATLEYFAADDRATFSAALVPVGTCRLIIDNDCHAPARRRASITHEMAHVILEHQFTASILTPDGCRAVDPELEEEATHLSGELLVPSDAAIQLAVRGASDNDVAHRFGVSLQLATWRMNGSGARKIASRARAKRTAAGD